MRKILKLSLLIIPVSILYYCKEKPVSPVISTKDVTEISAVTSVSGGIISDDGGAAILSKGVCWNTSDHPTIEDAKTNDIGGSNSFTSNISQLTPATLYYVRAYATNSAGTGYGESVSFTTLGDIPTVISSNSSDITINSATLNGTINPKSLSTTVTFEWGTTTSYGNIVIPSQNILTGSTAENVTAVLSGLTAESTYHFRMKATNELGTSYGEDLTFTTYSLVDIDENYYHTVTIGTQTWMKENLKTTMYRNGDLLETTTPATLDISVESEPKYQWATNNDELNVALYGRLYSWYAVADNRNICPAGWHVPSRTEWTTLLEYLIGNGYGYQGSGNDIAKSLTAISWWHTSDVIGTGGNDQANNNSSGFTALPGGVRHFNGAFQDFGYGTYFWTSTPWFTQAYTEVLFYDNVNVLEIICDKPDGYSVRCIKD